HLRMRMFDDREGDRRRPALAVDVEGVRAFVHAPAVVLALVYEVSRFPKVLTVLTHPECARLAIEGKAPGIAKAIGVNLRPGAGNIQEWIVLRHRIRLICTRMIHVDADH